jgi:hypothetical protein
VVIGTTPQVKPIRISELLGVAVRSAQQQDEQLLGPDPPACELYLLENAADRYLNGGLVAQQLLDGGSNRLGLLAQTSELFRMLQQGEHSIRDGSRHVPRACMKEKHTVRENFVFAERRFVCFYRQAAPNDIVGEVLSPSDNHRPDVRADRFKLFTAFFAFNTVS